MSEEGTTTLRMMGTADVNNAPTLPAFMVSRSQGLALRDRVLCLWQQERVTPLQQVKHIQALRKNLSKCSLACKTWNPEQLIQEEQALLALGMIVLDSNGSFLPN